ncbi:MAG TPA: nitrous oxide reductase accessory protein NosL [Pseudonocardiaceae bacterium]
MSKGDTFVGRRAFLTGAAGLAAVATGGLLAGCGKKGTPDGPVAITSSDTCARCGMLISDMRYAAEIVGTEHVWKFDDPGEMFAYYHEQHIAANEVKAMYVDDFRTKTWLPAKSAHFVVNRTQFQTPMGSGVAAFADAAAVQQYTASGSGVARSYEQLLAEPPLLRPM